MYRDVDPAIVSQLDCTGSEFPAEMRSEDGADFQKLWKVAASRGGIDYRRGGLPKLLGAFPEIKTDAKTVASEPYQTRRSSKDTR